MRTLTLLGRNVRRVREGRGMTREALSAKADVSVHVLGRIEAGTGNPTALVVFRLARALGVHPHELFAAPPPRPRKDGPRDIAPARRRKT